MTTATIEKNETYRRLIRGIYEVNSAVDPILMKSRFISINAEVASAKIGPAGKPFGILAREMTKISGELSDMMVRIEKAFQSSVGHIAQLFRHEKEIELLGRGEAICKAYDAEEKNSALPMVPFTTALEATPSQRKPFQIADTTSATASEEKATRMMLELFSTRKKLTLQRIENLALVVKDSIKSIHRILKDMSQSIGRESLFLGMFAKVEASHLNDNTSNISSVAVAIENLAREIENALMLATNKL